jgi:hypothetical protein
VNVMRFAEKCVEQMSVIDDLNRQGKTKLNKKEMVIEIFQKKLPWDKLSRPVKKPCLIKDFSIKRVV